MHQHEIKQLPKLLKSIWTTKQTNQQTASSHDIAIQVISYTHCKYTVGAFKNLL